MANITFWGVFTSLVVYFFYRQYQNAKLLSNVDWLGSPEGRLSFLLPRFRARIQNIINFKKTLVKGYEEYGLKGKPCVLPTIADDLLILPPDEINWIIAQPDNVLSVKMPHIDNLQADYTFSHPQIVRNATHEQVIRSDLTRQLNNLTTEIVDELYHSTDHYWGNDTKNWKEVCVYDTVMQIVARTSNRVFVGLPLCRDEEFLANAAGFARQVPTMSLLLRQFPKLIRPLIAPVVMRKNKAHIAGTTAQIAPEIKRRQQLLSEAGGDEKKANLPNDLLTWLILLASTSPDPSEQTAEIIAGRLLAIQFAAIHTSTFSGTNVIFDLISDPKHSPQYITELRQEASSILAANNNQWTKTGLSKMYKTDSCLRESTRLGSFLGPGLTRKVIAPEGLTTPSGIHCPYGTQVAVLSHGIHNDEKKYTDAGKFDPFRFADQRLEDQPNQNHQSDESNNSNSDSNSYIKKANLAFVSTSSNYHPFGHGRHACPGRFFASNELKILLAYIVMNYDFEILDERPESKWIGTTFLPPMSSKIRVRRRKV